MPDADGRPRLRPEGVRLSQKVERNGLDSDGQTQSSAVRTREGASVTHGEQMRLARALLQFRASAALARVEAFNVCVRLPGVADSRARLLEARIRTRLISETPAT